MDSQDIQEKIQIIMRQTNYDQETSREKLVEFNNDHIKVIKSYFGIANDTKKKILFQSLNQEIYKEIRKKIDLNEYHKKQEAKLKTELGMVESLRLEEVD
jgi:hypothetical protein